MLGGNLGSLLYGDVSVMALPTNTDNNDPSDNDNYTDHSSHLGDRLRCRKYMRTVLSSDKDSLHQYMQLS